MRNLDPILTGDVPDLSALPDLAPLTKRHVMAICGRSAPSIDRDVNGGLLKRTKYARKSVYLVLDVRNYLLRLQGIEAQA